MKIAGFNKLTLLDFPKHTACIIFVAGCNMRCPFCHNSNMVEGSYDEIDLAEVFSYLQKRQGLLEGVVVSGGEPTIYNDLVPFIESIKQLGYKVKLDTNGSNPDVLEQLLNENLLDYVAMDVKNSLSKYAQTTGVNLSTDSIVKSINLLKNSTVDHEFRTTVVGELHTANDIEQIAELISGEKYFIQCYVDNGSTFDGSLTPPTNEQLDQFKKKAEKQVKSVELR